MIPIEELRVGNWAADSKTGGYFKFGNGQAIDNFYLCSDPIKLTPEVLIKGLQMPPTSDYHPEGKTWFIKHSCDLQFEIIPAYGIVRLYNRYPFRFMRQLRISTVHELQNCYRFNTGEELNIRL